MDMELPESHQMLRDTVREFAEQEIKPVAGELDEKEEFSVELTRKMGELGLFGIFLPEEYGGQGMDYLAYIVAVEEISRVDGSQGATVAAGNSLGLGPIYYFGSEEQKRKYLPDLCAGKKLFAFGLTEPNAGSDAGGTQTTARREGDEWVINGSKIFITNASTPITWGTVVQTVTGKREDGKKEYTTFIVENGVPGFEAKPMHKKMMWRASNTSELYFDNCRVKDSAMLGKRGEGFHQMLHTLDSGRLAIAAMGLGCAQGALDLALDYTSQRKQFGRPINTFQAVAFRLADVATEVEAARALLYRACWLRDSGRPFAKEAAMAKLYCSEVALRAVNAGVQAMGGYGLMKEYGMERYYRDQKLLEIGEGTSEIQRLVIARHLGCRPQ